MAQILSLHIAASIEANNMNAMLPINLIFSLVVLTVPSWISTRGAEPQAKEQRFSIEKPPTSIVFATAFSPDSKLLAVACYDKTVLIYDVPSGKQCVVLRGHSERIWSVAFAPDGKSLISGSGEYRTPNDPGEVKIWDLETGKERASLVGHKGLVFAVAFTPDGREALSASWDSTVKIWDVATAKEKASLTEHKGPVRAIGFSPDSKMLASASFDGSVILWDSATLKKQRRIEAHEVGVQALAYSPSSRIFATADRPTEAMTRGEVKIWDLDTGRQLSRLEGIVSRVLSLDFSPDGRMLAVSGGNFTQSGEVKLIERCSGKERANLKGHKEWVESVRFSPDGRMLLSGGGFTREVPGELRVWHLADLHEARAPETLTPKEVESRWQDLASEDAVVAYQAVWALASAPKAAVSLLKEHVQPRARIDEKEAEMLINDLDDETFKVRERAAKGLEALSDRAESIMQRTLKGNVTLEVRQRLEKLLEKLPTGPKQLQMLRATETLEQIGSAEARQVLERVAAGMPDARLTIEAEASLKRLNATDEKRPK
jgi:WD40 repeat protein